MRGDTSMYREISETPQNALYAFVFDGFRGIRGIS